MYDNETAIPSLYDETETGTESFLSKPVFTLRIQLPSCAIQYRSSVCLTANVKLLV